MEGGFQIDVRNNIDLLLRSLNETRNNSLPFWTAYALTKTAEDIKAREVELMAEVFDRPTRFTLNSLYVKRANKRDLRAYVLFRPGFNSVPAWRYLGPEVMGGPRVKKSHERALERAGILLGSEFCVPGRNVPLDSSGNMRGGHITRMLSDLGANPDALSNSTPKSRKRNARRARYFLLRRGGHPGWPNSDRDVPTGIYERNGERLRPYILFVRQPQYRKRFPFYETAELVFRQRFAMRFREAVQRYPNRTRTARRA